ncbi:MAG: HlyD family efflux transporter periplasmic adaptor subunit [Oscillospiraceae bacterium]|jgi:HlyD family secretion protein|nr:HlyD family efflux transporter periplasmic adaptor subunit [Oscillospiraceae bacterium]
MKKSTILDMKDLSDSREVLFERPHRFVAWFGYGLIALIAVALIWAFLGRIDYYVKAQGEVRPNESMSVIRNTVTGRVRTVALSEGQRVQKGDLLFSMEVETQLNTASVLERQVASIDLEAANLEKYKTSIVEGENLFDLGDPDELDYYFRYQKYVIDRDVAVEQIKNTNADFSRLMNEAQISESSAQNNRRRIESEIADLQLLLQSIDGGENLIPEDDAETYGRFVDYQLTLARYAALVELQQTQKDRMEALYAAGGASLKELETARYDLESTRQEREKYKNESRLNVSQSLTALRKNLGDLTAAVQSARAVFSAYTDRGYSEDLIAEKSKLDALAVTADTLFTLQNNADTLRKDLHAIRLSIAEANVIAPIDGTVSLQTEINSGDFLQSGTEIATIIPGADGELKVLLAVSNADIADIVEGQTVHYRFSALPFRQYGELEGVITKISADARGNGAGQSHYLVEAALPNTVLVGRDGTPESLKVGMSVEARVITKNARIIHWVLEKMNFIDG